LRPSSRFSRVCKHGPKAVNPKFLPSDLLIAQWRDVIDCKSWQWIYGVIATYGLRPHEALRATWEDYPICRIPENTKTGTRFVLPLYPEWAENWELKNQILPGINLDFPNEKLSSKISKYFYNNKDRWQTKVGKTQKFTPIYLRHCYARRCFEFHLAPDWAAGLMGHSVKVHLSTYRAWIDEKIYLKVYQSVIDRPNRPLPP
jgi:integrase